MPDKAIDIMDETGAEVKLNEERKEKIVNTEDVENMVARIVHAAVL